MAISYKQQPIKTIKNHYYMVCPYCNCSTSSEYEDCTHCGAKLYTYVVIDTIYACITTNHNEHGVTLSTFRHNFYISREDAETEFFDMQDEKKDSTPIRWHERDFSCWTNSFDILGRPIADFDFDQGRSQCGLYAIRCHQPFQVQYCDPKILNFPRGMPLYYEIVDYTIEDGLFSNINSFGLFDNRIKAKKIIDDIALQVIERDNTLTVKVKDNMRYYYRYIDDEDSSKTHSIYHVEIFKDRHPIRWIGLHIGCNQYQQIGKPKYW